MYPLTAHDRGNFNSLLGFMVQRYGISYEQFWNDKIIRIEIVEEIVVCHASVKPLVSLHDSNFAITSLVICLRTPAAALKK